METTTAKEFLQKKEYPSYSSRGGLGLSYVKEAMVEFAKLHVEAALKAASEKGLVEADEGGYTSFVDKESILNAYPLENIK